MSATTTLTPLFPGAPGLKIGAVEIPTRVFMAPMMGYNEPPLRRIHRRFGSGLCITEMLKPEQLEKPSKRLLQELAIEAEEHPVSAQISGREPEPAVHAARQLRELGFDIIDLNFGCPNKKECNRGRGATMMRHPELVGELVAALVAALDCPVTVKLRAGWSCEEPTAPAVARAAVDAGAAAVCVHGRSKLGWYRTANDLSVIKATREAVPEVPFIANGDIVDIPSALEMFEVTGADAVMIGRGSVGNPWVFSRIQAAVVEGREDPPPDADALAEVFLEHARGLHECFKRALAFRFARKYLFFYFARIIDNDDRATIARAKTLADLEAIVAELRERSPIRSSDAPLRALKE